jgi:hypothetical protein
MNDVEFCLVVQNSEELRGIRERLAAYPRSAAYSATLPQLVFLFFEESFVHKFLLRF